MSDISKVFLRKKELLDYLGLEDSPDYDENPQFAMRVPLSYAEKIQKCNPNDPLLRQVIPTIKENEIHEGFCDDPVGDGMAGRDSGIEQKYDGRILLIAGSACSVKCRYCFRRNESCCMPQDLDKRLENYLKEKGNIREIILSGGDPLMSPPEAIEKLFEKATLEPSVRTIRIHTRVPLTEPERLELYKPILEKYKERFRLVIVLHTNHANELTGKTPCVISGLRNLGIHFLNQSVLLKGVNDNTETLCELSEKLFECGVLPYYLHQLDHANGAAHFEVSDKIALKIMDGLRKRLPGYLVPRLVREIAGEQSKTPIENNSEFSIQN